MRNLQTRTSDRRTAFTLMEMLVVVAILVVLAGVGGYYYLQHLDEAKVSAAKLQVKVLTQAAEAYYTKTGEWPPSLATLTQRSEDGGRPLLDPDALVTPWKTAYGYDANGQQNGGNKPDIWADIPKGGRVGNWSGQR